MKWVAAEGGFALEAQGNRGIYRILSEIGSTGKTYSLYDNGVFVTTEKPVDVLVNIAEGREVDYFLMSKKLRKFEAEVLREIQENITKD